MIALLTGALIWWWWPAPERERAVREVEVVAAREAEKRPAGQPAGIAEEQPARPEPQATIPDDPVQSGPCALELLLQDADDGARIAGRVRLYRLDAPGNEQWTAGDQLQAELDVPADGATIRDLPAGRYLPYCAMQRYPPVDPGAIEVSGARTRATVVVPMPRAHPAWLRVLDENGRGIESGGTLAGFDGTYQLRDPHPPWIRRRKERSGALRGGGGGGGTRGAHRVVNARGERGLYRLRERREDDCSKKRTVHWRWSAPGRTSVRARVALERWTGATFVGVSVPIEWVHRSVLLPGGGRAADAGATFNAWCPAVRDDSAPSIHVRVVLEGYEELLFEFEPGEEIAPRTLERTTKELTR